MHQLNIAKSNLRCGCSHEERTHGESQIKGRVHHPYDLGEAYLALSSRVSASSVMIEAINPDLNLESRWE